jgi:uncharacterized membrane protein YhhN
VGVYKIIFIILVVWMVLGAISKLLEKENAATRDFFIASILMFIAGLAMKCMINGEHVYRARGWQLPNNNRVPIINFA